jgi:hypothetical protein
MKLFLVPTMVFAGSIWKNKSGWFLFVMSLGLSVATENLDCWGPLLIFNPWLAQNQFCTPHHRANETLSCPYNGVCLLDTSHWAWIASKMYHLDTSGVALQRCANGHQRQTTPLITA